MMTDMVMKNTLEADSPELRDYYELLKPRVMRLVVFTSFVGLVVAPTSMPPMLILISLLCIALGAGASGALNMYIDHDIDAIMQRTADRPIPSGRVPREHALGLGIFASCFSVAMLGLFANWMAGAFLAFTIFFYVVIYSIGLKRRTTQNIVIGGAAGAFPPALGWVAATGDLALEPVMLVLVIFLWTPAHFWALALYRNDDYTNAKVPMFPVVFGEAATRKQILLYTILFVVSCILTSVTSIGGPITLFVSIVLGGVFTWRAVGLLGRNGKSDNYLMEKRFFALSIVFLFVFFLAILCDYVLNYYFALSFIQLL